MLTDFLKLTLTDASETGMTFLEWRTLMNGVDCDSNMELIDAFIAKLYRLVNGKADGFTLDAETGVLQLTSYGEPIDGASVTINLNKYYTKDEVDVLVDDLANSVANNDTILAIKQAALGNLAWDESTRALTMYNINGTQVGDSIVITGGGGGGGGGSTYSIRIVNGMSSLALTAATSGSTVVKASFYEYYGSVETGWGGEMSVSYKLDTDSTYTEYMSGVTVAQGVEFAVDVTSLLTVDKTTNVKLTIKGGESGLSRSIVYSITQVEASIAAVNFNDAATYTGNFNFVYKCVGRGLEKTVHFVIDGEEVASVDVGTSHNTNLTQTIQLVGKYSYGAHQLEVYFTTTDGAISNTLRYAIIYDDGTGTDPIIAVVAEQEEVTYGDTISVRYVVYTPEKETTDELNIRVYAIADTGEVEYYSNGLVDIPNNTAGTWQGTSYPDSGVTYIEFTSGSTMETVEVYVNEIDTEYNLHPISTNLVYKYSAAGRSNNDANKELYECDYTTAAGITTAIKGSFDGLNWVSNGYIDNESVTISGEGVHTIQLPIFSTSYTDDMGQTVNLESASDDTVTSNGRTIEIEFKVSNVTDNTAHIIECMSSDHAGFVVTPQNCWLLASNGQDVALDSTGFIENEESIPAAYIKDGTRIRLAFVIEPVGSVQYTDTDGTSKSGQCANIYINGQYANSFPYDSTYRYNSTEYIKMGDSSCILNLYDVRIYNRGLTSEEVMQNYMASPLSVQNRILRFEDNDVLTDTGDVDYYKAREKYNCLLVTGSLSPFKGANGPLSGREEKYECGLTLTKVGENVVTNGINVTTVATHGLTADIAEGSVWADNNGLLWELADFTGDNQIKFVLGDDNDSESGDDISITTLTCKSGTLQVWPISGTVGEGATYNGPSYVSKDSELSTTITLVDGYTVGSAGVTVTMGGSTLADAATVSGTTVSITIASVTGDVVITVPTYKTSTSTDCSSSSISGLNLNLPVTAFEWATTTYGFTTEFELLDTDANGVWVCSNNVQGTSSQKFPVKNYKMYLVKAATDDEGNFTTKKVKYALKGKDSDGNALSVAESTLCWKADYMSSDHANTFNANLADTLFTDLTPAQEENSLVQNTVWGFRCLLFQRDNETASIRFAGDGALNNDKGNSKSFGLEVSGDKGNDTMCQKWEFLNNTEDICKFKTDALQASVTDSKGNVVAAVTAALESTYPDQGDLEDDYGVTPNYDHIQALYTWVCQRANFWDASTDTLSTPITYNGSTYTTERDYRKAIFQNEFDLHFNRNHALVYYLFMEFVALCDNRGKNMFLQSFDVRSESLLNVNGEAMSMSDAIDSETGTVDADMIDWENSTFAVWYPVLYDLDSCFGVENSGYMWIPYYADWDYTLNGANKFNSHDSKFWLMFEEAMANDIMAEAQSITEKPSGFGGLNYEALYDVHIRDNAELICPAVVNRDMEYKYHDPWIEGFVNYSVDGNPVQHISTYKYMQRGSRTQQKDAFIYRRCNMLYSKYQCNKFMQNNINFRSGTDLSLADSYLTIKTNQTMYPAARFSDTSSSAVATCGRIDAGEEGILVKPGTSGVGKTDTVYISGASFITDIGDVSRFIPYELQLQNATGLSRLLVGSFDEGYKNTQLTAIEPTACKLLEEINFMGCTALSDVDLSYNGLLKKVYASGSSASLVKLPNGGVLEDLYLGTITDLVVLNHTNLTNFDCDSYNSLVLFHVENTPVIPTQAIFEERLDKLTGVRLVGIDWTTQDGITVTLDADHEYEPNDVRDSVWTDDSGLLWNLYCVPNTNQLRFVPGEDNASIKDGWVAPTSLTCSDLGLTVTPAEVVWNDTIELLERLVSSEAQGKYVTSDSKLSDNAALYPYISGTIHTDYIGTRLLDTLNATYPDLYIDAADKIEQYEVVFQNWDGTVLNTQLVYRGSDAVDPVETGLIEKPTRESTVSTNYAYAGWDGTFTRVSGDIVIVATYTETVREYTVRWLNGSTVLESVTALYGDGVEYSGSTPIDTSQESYLVYRLFDGWTHNTSFVDGDIDAYAKFTEATAPTDKTLSEMTPAELYALIKTGVLSPSSTTNTLIASGDTIDVVMGKDYDFTGISSTELVPLSSPMVFDGTNYYDTGIKLYDEDKAFTLAIDFEFASATDTTVLASCYESNGFALRYNGNPTVRLGLTSSVQVATGVRREMVVIRKSLGDPNLYVYASNRVSSAIIEQTIENTVTIQHEAPLSFGANVQSDGYIANYATGKIYWSKIWMADLGPATCRNLACWTRSTVTMQAAGNDDYTFNMFTRADNARYVNCCFLAKNLLDIYQQMNTTSTNAGGWKSSFLRSWLNSRVYDALPDQWKLLITQINMNTSDGSNTIKINTTEDYIYVPPSKAMGFFTTTTPYVSECDATFDLFTTPASRIKYLDNGSGAANEWWVASAFYSTTSTSGTSQYFHTVTEAGASGIAYAPNSSIGVCFGFCI